MPVFDSLASTNTLPTDTVGQPGNTIDAFGNYVSAQLNYKLGNTAGYDVRGQGGVQTDPDLIDKYQSAKWVSSYVTLANTFNCSFASNIYTLTPKTLATGDTYALPYQLPTILQNDMPFQFVATNSNTTTASIAITGLTSALPIVKTNNASGTLTYSTLSSGDIIAGQKIVVIYNSTAASGSPAFVIHRQFASQLSGNISSATTTSLGTVYLSQKILISNNVSTPNTQLDYSAGVFQFSDGTGQAVLSAGTINCATTGVNGLDTGSLGASASYHAFAIYNPTTSVSAGLASNSPTSPTLPSGYTKFKRIGAFRTNASSQILQGTWYSNNYFDFVTPILAISNVSQTANTETLRTLPVPTGINVIVRGRIAGACYGSGAAYFKIYNPAITSVTMNTDDANLYASTNVTFGCSVIDEISNTSGQLKTNAFNVLGSPSKVISINIDGWVDFTL